MSDVIKTTMDAPSEAVDNSVDSMPRTSLAVDLLKRCTESTMKRVMALVHEVAEDGVPNIPHSKMPLAFDTFRCLLGVYITMLGGTDF